MGAKKKKLNKRTKFTLFAMFNIVWFTIVVLVFSYLEREVNDVLITCWFASWTVELGLLFGIKINNKGGDDE